MRMSGETIDGLVFWRYICITLLYDSSEKVLGSGCGRGEDMDAMGTCSSRDFIDEF